MTFLAFSPYKVFESHRYLLFRSTLSSLCEKSLSLSIDNTYSHSTARPQKQRTEPGIHNGNASSIKPRALVLSSPRVTSEQATQEPTTPLLLLLLLLLLDDTSPGTHLLILETLSRLIIDSISTRACPLPHKILLLTGTSSLRLARDNTSRRDIVASRHRSEP